MIMSNSRFVSVVTATQCMKTKFRSTLIYSSKPAAWWVVGNLSKPASLFSLKFRLVSGRKAGTRLVQSAAVSASSVSLNYALLAGTY